MPDEMSVAERIRQRGRVKVLLPELQELIEFRAYTVGHMLETGLGARITDFAEESENAADDAARVLQEAKDIVIAYSVNPRLTHEETNHPGCLCIDDIPDGDILHAFKEVTTLSSSRFFGVNRTAFGINPDAYASVIDGQMKVCYQIDVICGRWGEHYDEVKEWPDWKLAEAISVIEGAEGYRKAHPQIGRAHV